MGSIDLAPQHLDFRVGADGFLRLEFFEDWDDIAGVDGAWDFGTITFNAEQAPTAVPEPATSLLFGAGLALPGYAGRRRRSDAGARAVA